MKSVTTELNHIKDLLQVIVLAHPGIHFRASHNDTTLFNYPAVNSLEERLLSIYSTEFLKGLKPVNITWSSYNLNGYLGLPTNTRSARDFQFFYVNGRSVKNPMLTHALYEGYRDTIPKGRHPIFVVFLDLPYSEVDVNVHPSKTEVRFRKSSILHDFIKNMILDTLRKPGNIHPKPERQDTSSVRIDHTGLDPRVPVSFPGTPSETVQAGSPESNRHDFKHTGEMIQLPDISGQPEPEPETITPVHSQPSFAETTASDSIDRLADAHLIGQLHRTFILLEDDESLLLIDQHTAHERILYTSFLETLKQTGLKSQGLLFPLNIPVTPGDVRIAVASSKLLKSAGFHVEEFGTDTLLLRSIPEVLGDRDPTEIFLDILAELKDAGTSESLEDILREIARIIACRSAVKAGDTLDRTELEHLIKSLSESTVHYTCPHGRPIVIRYPIDAIQKAFGR
jgi:DNA mismatch repair protein MutL